MNNGGRGYAVSRTLEIQGTADFELDPGLTSLSLMAARRSSVHVSRLESDSAVGAVSQEILPVVTRSHSPECRSRAVHDQIAS